MVLCWIAALVSWLFLATLIFWDSWEGRCGAYFRGINLPPDIEGDAKQWYQARRQANYALASVFVGFLTLSAAIGGGYVAYRAFKEAQRQTLAAQGQLDAALLEQRAFVIVDNLEVSQVNGHDPEGYDLWLEKPVIKNYGTLPAHNVTIIQSERHWPNRFDIGLDEAALPPDPADLKVDLSTPWNLAFQKTYLAPQQERSIRGNEFSTFLMQANRKYVMIVFGIVRYDFETAESPHRRNSYAKFCYSIGLSRATDKLQPVPIPCPLWNCTDEVECNDDLEIYRRAKRISSEAEAIRNLLITDKDAENNQIKKYFENLPPRQPSLRCPGPWKDC